MIMMTMAITWHPLILLKVLGGSFSRRNYLSFSNFSHRMQWTIISKSFPSRSNFFFYIYYYPWGARRSTFWRYHNLNSVRHRKSTNHPSCTCTCSACSFNIGLALLLGIRSLDPRPRARTAPALAWCRRQLGSQTSCSAKSRSQFWSLTFNDKHWNVWWNLAS